LLIGALSFAVPIVEAIDLCLYRCLLLIERHALAIEPSSIGLSRSLPLLARFG
jgi:hypothetical protein